MIRWFVICMMVLGFALPLWAQEPTETAQAEPNYELEEENEKLLLSARAELIFYGNETEPVRQNTNQHTRLYFNNVYITAEGQINTKMSFIAEFQPVTSELYQLGGFVTAADSLQGIGEPGIPLYGRKRAVTNRVNSLLNDIDKASEAPAIERVQLSYEMHPLFGLNIGKVRVPFGYWDDYSLFRNLSLGKTDPVTLGVPLRRTDLGITFFGDLFGKYLTYDLGMLEGSYVFFNKDPNKHKDLTARLGSSLGPIDFGLNGYVHNFAREAGAPLAGGLYFRWLITNDLTLLGEFVAMRNDELDLNSTFIYLQFNYDLGTFLEGLRFNTFLEMYDSDLYRIDIEPLDYIFLGSTIQGSTGFLYGINRNVDIGIQFITGYDEEGDAFYKGAMKLDVRL